MKSDNKNNSANETKVICPVCGSEFAIGEHEHKVKNATVIGMDSGLGTVVLPVSKRGDALKAAGIDPAKYFSIQLPTGGEQLMKMDADGKAVPVSSDDPVISQIINGGTIPNRNLFRRWVMAQVFRGLTERDYHGRLLGFNSWMKQHGYDYTWKMLIEELRVQSKLFGKDMENFAARNRWFNQRLALTMAHDYIDQLESDAMKRPQHKCKGIPYVTIAGRHYFLSDISKKLLAPMRTALADIAVANTPKKLEYAVIKFWKAAPTTDWSYNQCAEWKDAYKGAGAYFTMQNLLRFHGCKFPKDNDFYKPGVSGLTMLESAANLYHDEGWRLFGLMKQMIEENGIDIEAKRKAWAAAKSSKLS